MDLDDALKTTPPELTARAGGRHGGKRDNVSSDYGPWIVVGIVTNVIDL